MYVSEMREKYFLIGKKLFYFVVGSKGLPGDVGYEIISVKV